MEPIPETTAAVEEFGPFSTREADLLDELREQAAQVQRLVPQCIGLSLASLEHGVSFTLVASDQDIAALDGVQYLAGGPCVTAVEVGEVVSLSVNELFAEDQWRAFASASAAHSVASTLTLPVVVEGQVIGSVNLYAASPDAFTGRHQAMADIFDAWAPGAVTNADLDFTTRQVAEQAPAILLEQVTLQAAVGIVIALHGVDARSAAAQLVDAARRAGVSVAAVAAKLVAGSPIAGLDVDAD